MDWNPAIRAAGWALLFLLFSGLCYGQSSVPRRISGPVNDAELTRLSGSIHPQTRRALDQGSLPGTTTLRRMAIFFQPGPAQQSDLQKLLAEQQDPSSPNYHKWLTPEEYGMRFGMHPDDLATVARWLQAQGFRNISTARSRTYIEFDGTVAQIQAVFRTPIHQFVVNGERHYANTVEPSLPSAFSGMVSGITALNNFRPRPMSVAHFTSNLSGKHFLAPGDVGTIYNIKGLYDSGIDGSGQTVAVVGQTKLSTDLSHADIDTFRSLAGLPTINLQQILVGADPGVSSSDVDEANLDIEWAGGIARNAKVLFYYSNNALFSSMNQAIQDNTASVISVSYGNCEASFSSSDITTLTNITQQAASQGQTIVAAAGDSGAADCDGTAANPATIATHGLAVDMPASFQFVTGMGGTQFNGDDTASFTCDPPGSQNCTAADTQYWKGSSSKTDTSPSALSYIPEAVWNNTTSTAISAGGGGVSKVIGRPAWQPASDFQASANPNSVTLSRGGNSQVTISMTAAGQRSLPDISLTSSPDHDGYLICSKGSCVNGYRRSDDTVNVIGGTSAASPVFSGIVALMNQKFGSRQGNVNSTLYSLGASASNAFHDITTGDNKVPCQMGTTDCPSGGTIGYSAGTGYDLASGLGSIDVGAAVAAWQNAGPPPTGNFQGTITLTCSVSSSLGATTCSVSPTTISAGQNATLTITATSSAAMKTPRLPGMPRGLEMSFGLVAALLSIPQLGRGRQVRKVLRSTGLLLLIVLVVAGMVACGGGGSGNSNGGGNSISPLNGSVTVQATSGSLSHNVVIPVTIN